MNANPAARESAKGEEERARLRAVLEQARRERRTLTYLEVADRMGLEPPRRIHRVTRLLESLLNEDVRADRPPLAALAVSRVRDGLPAPGFFDRLRRLGVDAASDPAALHREILERLFDSSISL